MLKAEGSDEQPPSRKEDDGQRDFCDGQCAAQPASTLPGVVAAWCDDGASRTRRL